MLTNAGGEVTGITICKTTVRDLSMATADFSNYTDSGYELTALEKFHVLELNNEIVAANGCIKLIRRKSRCF